VGCVDTDENYTGSSPARGIVRRKSGGRTLGNPVRRTRATQSVRGQKPEPATRHSITWHSDGKDSDCKGPRERLHKDLRRKGCTILRIIKGSGAIGEIAREHPKAEESPISLEDSLPVLGGWPRGGSTLKGEKCVEKTCEGKRAFSWGEGVGKVVKRFRGCENGAPSKAGPQKGGNRDGGRHDRWEDEGIVEDE